MSTYNFNDGNNFKIQKSAENSLIFPTENTLQNLLWVLQISYYSIALPHKNIVVIHHI